MEDILPKVAVISIYYNREGHIYDSVRSLFTQTYNNLEIHVVDDCSSDATFLKLKEIESEDTRINLSRNAKNKGFTRTLIDTIASIDAQYIAIHGAGDISLPTRIQEQVKYLELNSQVGVLTTDITNIKKPKFHKTEITLDDLLKKNRITHGTVMFRKEAYLVVGGYREFFSSRQDKDLWFRMSLITKIHFLPLKLYELVDIQKSVSQTAYISGIPILMSSYTIHLIKERIKNGKDSLDSHGDKGVLLFNPSLANGLLYENIILNIIYYKMNKVEGYVNVLIKINKNIFLIFFFKIIKYLLKIFKKK